MKVLLAI